MQTIETDVLVIGSGIAGLATALAASPYREVLVLSKDQLDRCNSTLAQGGIAAAVGKDDSPEKHTEDTLFAGAGICQKETVEILTHEAPSIIKHLAEMGAPFDRTASGELALGREGAHSLARVIHRGDDTGAAIWKTLLRKAQSERIRFFPETRAEKLLVEKGGCYGAVVRNQQGVFRVKAGAVVLATGGIGQIYGRTTNSVLSTGDGLALAWKAGAVLSDLEFVQFHPTALATDENPLFLISEAVRGEGAILVTEESEPFMPKYHPQADLAPRDVVTRAILCEQRKGHHIYLDATALGYIFAQRFPTIYEKVRSQKINPAQDFIPVTPAAHFFMGGIQTDSFGRTNIPGLYACGECANTGVHGANRLASNSLLEGLVFGQRVALGLVQDMKKHYSKEGIEVFAYEDLLLADVPSNKAETLPLKLDDPCVRKIQELMWNYVGIMRDEPGMMKTYEELCRLEDQIGSGVDELNNMILVARLITSSALQRLESRGSHYRVDYPFQDPAWQQKHVNLRRQTA